MYMSLPLPHANSASTVATTTANALYTKLYKLGLNDDDISSAAAHLRRRRSAPNGHNRIRVDEHDVNTTSNHDDDEHFVPNPQVIKEGYLVKQSAHLKTLRQRWMVLKGYHLYSYKEMQVYEDATETFDCREYATVKIADTDHRPRQSDRGRTFELISLTSERRVFVAPTHSAMMQWMQCLKKVILFSRPYGAMNFKCRSLRSCVSLRRVRDVLAWDLHANTSIVPYMRSYAQLINDFHHLLEHHLNDENGNSNCKDRNKSMQLICHMLGPRVSCRNGDHGCAFEYRLHRRREQEDPTLQQAQMDAHFNVYRDLLDTMHCVLVHAFDDGYCMAYETLQRIGAQTLNGDEDVTAHHVCMDDELMHLKQHLLRAQTRLQNVRGVERLQHNRFGCRIRTEQIMSPLTLNDYTILYYPNQSEIRRPCCEFGRRFVYHTDTNNASASTYFVTAKYENFKLELMDNMLYSIDIRIYIESYLKANRLLASSEFLTKIQCLHQNKFNIALNNPLQLPHVMALIFYCDFDALTGVFLSTYHPLCNLESDHQLIERHREFYHFAYLLNATVAAYGTSISATDPRRDRFYVNCSMQPFDRFMLNFNRPISMTTKMHIAVLYSADDGLLLELKNSNDNLRYFDCSLISSYSLEREVLFIADDGCHPLQIASIRSIVMNEQYRFEQFIAPLVLFEKIINGADIHQVMYPMDYAFISNLISSKIVHQKPIYPHYIVQCFQKFCNAQKCIKIHRKWLYNFTADFVHVQCGNLLLFDNIALVFKNVEVIYGMDTGDITKDYIKELMKILQHVNCEHNLKKKKKLRRIVLSGITSINISSNDLLTFVQNIRHSLRWNAQQTYNTVLILTKL